MNKVKELPTAVMTKYSKKVVNPNFYAKIIVQENENDATSSSNNG